MKEAPFSTVLTFLANPDQAFPARHLLRFSDISPDDLKAFLQVWPRVPLMRKRALLKNLNERFDEDTLLSYETLGAALLQDEDGVVRTLSL